MSVLPVGMGSSGGYEISRSVRLRSSASAYLNRTFTSVGTRTKFTYSVWLKRGTFGSFQRFFSDSTNNSYLRFSTGDTLDWNFYTGVSYTITTSQVFRDPSAWYHIVVAVDTTQATSSNRVKFYVNGSQVTAFSTASYPALNDVSNFDNNTAHYISSYSGSAEFFDGYLTEINFIDGQALTPSSFGETDSITGVWKPKKYTGTYGTNGFYLPFNIGTASTYALTNTGATKYINAPNNALFAQQSATNWTVEAWVNSSSATMQQLFSYANSTVNTGNDVAWGIHYTPGSTFSLFQYNGITNTGITSTLNVPSGQWCHIAAVNNGGTVTLYLNGTACGTTSAVNTNSTGTMLFYIGNYGSSRYINGQVSNFRLVKGTAVYTANFTPPTSPLTAITNTVLLTCQDSTFIDNSTNAFTLTNTGSLTTTTATPFSATIGSDSSGRGNNWYTNNINYSTSGVTYDSMLDVPTPYADGGNGRGNYCVVSSVDKRAGTVSVVQNAGLRAFANNTGMGAVHQRFRGTMRLDSPSYWEVIYGTGDAYWVADVGVCTEGWNVQTDGAVGASGTTSLGIFAAYDGSRSILQNGTALFSSLTWNAGDILQIAYDPTTGYVWMGRNGTWFNSGNPAAGTGSVGTVASPAFPAFAPRNSAYLDVNFGQRPFSYTPPTGFKCLNTQNLPDSTIKKGNAYFDVLPWTGNGGSQAILGLQFSPDFTWHKGRSSAFSHILINSVIGASKNLQSNTTNAEQTTTYMTSLDSNGFTITNTTGDNANGTTAVSWNWKAGGTAVSNTSGSITSQVSANTSAGFSVVTYTGTGANATVGHGLGVAPKMMIVKSRSATTSWNVYHVSTGNTGAMFLELTNAFAADSTRWNNTSPTSTVFSLGSGGGVNASAATFVAYCFTPVAGYSAFGSYTGNGSTTGDGPFVYLGFRPRYVMLKNASVAGTNWYVYDSVRNTYNQMGVELYPNASSAEASRVAIDFTSNGFKIRSTASGWDNNNNGNTIIYAAFAENPFKNSLAR